MFSFSDLSFVICFCYCCDTDTNILQDYCGDDMNGTFRVVAENIPCGTIESACYTSIKLYLGVHYT